MGNVKSSKKLKSIIEKITFDEKSKQGYNNNEKYFEN